MSNSSKNPQPRKQGKATEKLQYDRRKENRFTAPDRRLNNIEVRELSAEEADTLIN